MGICVDGAGNLYIADVANYRIRKVDASGIISTYAGTGTPVYGGDGGPATSATLYGLVDISADVSGNVYITDFDDNAVRKISTSGIISRYAGTGTAGYSGDGGPATAAEIDLPEHLANACGGQLYIADIGNRVRVVTSNRSPSFVNGDSYSISVCDSSTGNPIKSALAITDSDAGQTETWTVLTAPAHGALGGFPALATATTGTTTPTGLTYTPTAGYTGSDAFSIVVTDCGGAPDTITINVTVTIPVSSITGPTQVCGGDTITLSDSVSGGTWSSSNTTVATVDSLTGLVTGQTAGTVNITYMNVCDYRITTVTVNPLPLPMGGPSVLCLDSTIVLMDPTPGGTFSGTPIGTIHVSSGGSVAGVGAGTGTVTYTLPTGCYITETVTVITVPEVPPISGPDTICLGASIIESDLYPGGTWSSSNITVATVDSLAGIITGLTAGTATISYSVTNECGTTVKTRTVFVIGILPIAPIVGVDGLCSGTSDTFSDVDTGGMWLSSDPSVATVGITTGLVTGIASGTATITYLFPELCGVAFVTKTIVVNMNPFISTNTIVACQSLVSGGPQPPYGPGIILPDTGCILVCDSSIVRYYGNGDVGSAFTWVVTGGTIVYNYGDSIDILWPTVGTTGSITLFDTVSHCTGSYTVCIQVIEKPHAYFSTGGVFDFCLGDHVIFYDSSYADPLSPIVSYYWNFGDGTGSGVATPPPHAYTTPGYDTVTLVVKNACNCTDTFRMVLHILAGTGPQILCPSIVCDSEIATYSTPVVCSGYTWSVIGGTIVSGLGTQSIQVKWDHVGPAGFGYVRLAVACGSVCSDTTTIRVPVILQSPVISGPSQVCVGEQYEYSFPLWPATQYMWGVLGSPYPGGAIVGPNNDYKLVVNFTHPGTDTIHGWYQNRVKLCGANVDKVVTVVPATSILGNSIACQYSLDSFKLANPALVGSWTLTNALTGTVVGSGTGNAFVYTFDSTGTFVLTVTGTFCANPITITVPAAPAVVDSVKGADTVCLGQVYKYIAFSDITGTTYNWQAIGGTVSPPVGDSVSVIWTAGGTMQLIVSRASTTAPYCSSLPDTITVIQEAITANITGQDTVCANSYQTYNCNYTRGDMYNWNILPSTAGSVTSGNHSPVATVLWNNVTAPASAMIVLTINTCDSVKFDTFNVYINIGAPATIMASPDTACPATTVVFTAASGGSSYTWDFGDGTAITTTVDTVPHMFPPNITTGDLNYTVKVTITPNPLAPCPAVGVATMIETILPGPVATLSTDKHAICVDSSTLLVGTVTSNVSGLTYQWYYNWTAIAGATNSTYLTSVLGDYFFTVTASNGCTATSNILGIIRDTLCGFVAYFCQFDLTTSDLCNSITLTAGSDCSGTWTADIPPITPLPPSTLSVTATYPTPGIYWFTFTGIAPGCTIPQDTSVADTVGIVVDYYYRLRCGTGGMDTIALHDHTAYLPFWSPSTFTWTEDGATIGIGLNVTIVRPAPGRDTITETVTGTRPGGSFTCSMTRIIVLPDGPSAAFSDSISPICEGVPIDFTPTATGGVLYYYWEFGDEASSLLEFTKRTYTWVGPGSPELIPVTLTVTDSIGCEDSVNHTVDIFHNILNGHYSGLPTVNVICESSVPFIDGFSVTAGTGFGPYSYLWSDGSTANPISISQSGSYWVTVTDGADKCQQSFFPAQNVKILQPPPAVITGRQSYCRGAAITLSGYAGSSPLITYQWYRNGAMMSVSPSISDIEPVGTYVYSLVVTYTDTSGGMTPCSSSTTDTVQVFPLPAPPAITSVGAIDCNLYELEMTAAEPVPGIFNWSNGAHGATDTVYTGGPYRVWFTDANGCTSETDTLLPFSPDTYFPYFPTGCYSICDGMLPLTLYGPPNVVFKHWAWLEDSSKVDSGSNTAMEAYTIDSGGLYEWSLNSGFCSQTSDTMDVSFIQCVCNPSLTATVTFTPDNAASYGIAITFFSPDTATYTIGTDMGPMDPFSGSVPGLGTWPLTITFTTLTLPPPDSVTIELVLTFPNGAKCFQKLKVKLPAPCIWELEKPGDTTQSSRNLQPGNVAAGNALLVFPNPSSGSVTISYDYGTQFDGAHCDIAIYDELGRKKDYTVPQGAHGNWNVNTSDWTPGIYIIRMEADGAALQTQRLVVVSK